MLIEHCPHTERNTTAGPALREGEFCLMLDAGWTIRGIIGELPQQAGPREEVIGIPLAELFDPTARDPCEEACGIACQGRITAFSAVIRGGRAHFRCLLTVPLGRDDSRALCHISPFSHAVPIDGAPEHERVVNMVRATFSSFPPDRDSSKVDPRYLGFFDEIPVIVYGAAPDWQTAVFNRAAEEIFCYGRERVLGKQRETLLELLYPDPLYRARVVLDREVVTTGFLDWPMEPVCGDGFRREIIWSNLSGEIPLPGLISWAMGTCLRTEDFDSQRAAHRESIEKVKTAIGGATMCNPERILLPHNVVICGTSLPVMLRTRSMIEKLGIGTRLTDICADVIVAKLAVFPVDLLVIAPGADTATSDCRELRKLTSLLPRLPICIIHQGVPKEALIALVSAGARGSIDVTHAADELAPGLAAVHAGERWYPRDLVDFLFDHGRMMVCQTSTGRDPLACLTARQREILTLIALGYGNHHIALRLGVSLRTVTNHVYNMYGKLDISSRMEALIIAVQAGLADLSNLKK